MSKRRIFTEEFKEDAVNLLRSSDKPLTHVAKDLGISESALRSWNVNFDKDNPFPGQGNPRDIEIYELKKEIKNIKQERDILKKALAIFSQQNQRGTTL